MTTPLTAPKQCTDVEFESDLNDVAHQVTNLRSNPTDPLAYEDVSASVRQAKLLFLSISRARKAPVAGHQRLLRLAEEAISIAEESRSSIPQKSLNDFLYFLRALRRHVRSLRPHVLQHV